MSDHGEAPGADSDADDFEPWFHRETREVVGFYRLDKGAQEVVQDIFLEGLSDVVAAMWGFNHRISDPAYAERMAKFPALRVIRANRVLSRALVSELAVVRVVALLRNIAIEERKAGER